MNKQISTGTGIAVIAIIALAAIAGTIWFGRKPQIQTQAPAKVPQQLLPDSTQGRTGNNGSVRNGEARAIQAANGVSEVENLKRKYGANLITEVESMAAVYRVTYKDKARGIFLYGVDVDKSTGQIVEKGEMD